ncbi:hypothetical protein KZO01_20360 [Kurthia zopfii]|uniref:SIR2-like protein n=1 Tax=Kurthia zopfii TaxID=1650 RepID=A0A8B4QDG1_9BACL|nr:SIR2 family protein [Kurthia zopfii]PWI22434.1 hypothetical protein DF281_06925 [Kurthia zopfii]TDR38841.1 SIR2-like protein [Kurthia zopfii]GEK31727.1 hypothetical protein KZO01_20360 [Kurthia zopfii]STX10747.1 Uncharacterised protein [Kurthia zopfii]
MDIEDKLLLHLSKITTAPFLFIGSGFSKRYLDTESWEGLIRRFCELVPQGFGYYRSTSNSKWDIAAQMIAEDFHQIWWSDDRYSDSRKKFEEYATKKNSPLKIEISNYLKSKSYEYGIDKQNDIEINYLKEAVIDGIITTNWDTLLEQIFYEEEMTVYIGQKKLLFSNNLGVNEIYKIHGCSTEPDSLVLTNDDYEEFTSRNAYLASKLLTIFVEHPIIFIGYSISDTNIIQILESITACLDSTNINDLKDRLIFVDRAGGASESFQESTITINGLTIPITRVVTDKYEKVYRPLTTIKRKFSTKKLRQMKSEMYELIKHNDPKGKMKVINLYEGEVENDNIEFVVGFGMNHFAEQIEGIIDSTDRLKPSKLRHSSMGYITYSRTDLLKEVLADYDKFSYDYDELLKRTLPEKLKTDHNLPVNRFIKFSNITDIENLDHKIIKRKNMKINDFLNHQQRMMKKEFAFEWQFNSVKEVYDGYNNLEEKFFYIAVLKQDKIDLAELREILLQHIDLVESKNSEGANLRRLFSIYDYLAFADRN